MPAIVSLAVPGAAAAGFAEPPDERVWIAMTETSAVGARIGLDQPPN